MGFLPSPDTDLSNLTLKDLQSLQRRLEAELAMSKARQAHIEALLSNVTRSIETSK